MSCGCRAIAPPQVPPALTFSRSLSRSPSPHGRPSGATSLPSMRTTPSAIQAASSSAVWWNADTTLPRPTRFVPGTSTGTSRASSRRGTCTRAATSRTRSPLRKLTDSRRTGAGSPVVVGKSCTNRLRLPDEAPRQP